MSRRVLWALRGAIAVALVGSVVVQVVLILLLATDLDGQASGIGIVAGCIVLAAVVTLQVSGVCIWRLATMAARDAVFSPRAFRFVDAVIGSLVTCAVLVAGIAVTAAYGNRTQPGDEVAPGLVALVLGASVVIGGVALVVLVLRALLAQATALRTEIQGVI